MTAEQILDKYAVGVMSGQYTIDCHKAYQAMEEYCEQQADSFLKWVEDNHFCPNSSHLWFDYTIENRDEVHFYTRPQLYQWFRTGIKFVLPPLKLPQSHQSTNTQP